MDKNLPSSVNTQFPVNLSVLIVPKCYPWGEIINTPQGLAKNILPFLSNFIPSGFCLSIFFLRISVASKNILLFHNQKKIGLVSTIPQKANPSIEVLES